jgi:hypothetical protein
MGTSDKTKEMNRETENGGTTGWSRERDSQCKQNTSSSCSVRGYIPHCFVILVPVLTAKLRARARVCMCVCVEGRSLEAIAHAGLSCALLKHQRTL